MSYAEKIGNASAQPTAGDLERACTSRQVEADHWLYAHPHVDGELRDRVGTWISTGGPKPWEPQPSVGSTYPPVQPR
jgi:hypothetical protein